jgi:hypothetical protein
VRELSINIDVDLALGDAGIPRMADDHTREIGARLGEDPLLFQPRPVQYSPVTQSRC